MKVSKFLDFLGDSGYESKAIRYIYVYLIAFALLMWQFLITTQNLPDTQSYVYAANRLLNGEWDSFRTPVYPAVIALGKILFGAHWKCFTVALQLIAFFLSAITLQRLTLKLCESKKVTYWIVTSYLFLIALSSFPVRILTEAFSVSGVIFILWLLLRKYPQKPSLIDTCVATFILIILIFLRPLFIYLIPVFAVYFSGALWIYRKEFKATFLTSIISLSVATGCVQLYKHTMYTHFGINSISIVSSINNYFPIREAIELNPKLTENMQMRTYLQELKNRGMIHDLDSIFKETICLRDCSTDYEFETYVQSQINQNKFSFIKNIATRAYFKALPSVYFPLHYSDKVIYSNNIIFPIIIPLISWLLPSITIYFLFIIIYAIGWIAVWRHNKQIPLPSLLLLMVTAGITVASILGAQGEWCRLSLPGFPALLILIAMASRTISVSLKRYYTR